MFKLPAYKPNRSSEAVMIWNLLVGGVLILFGLLYQGDPLGSLSGFRTILFSDATLVTDYFETGGIGGAFVNAGLAMLLTLWTYRISGVKMSGGTFATCYIVAGFALFGKNVFNMVPILFGAWLYCKAVGDPFSKWVMVANLSTCAGPIVQYLMLHGITSSMFINVVLGLGLAVVIGFIVPPVSVYCAKLHEGFCLYNIGLTTGFVTIVITSFLKGFGYEFAYISDSWCTDHKMLLTVFFIILFGGHILAGVFLNGGFKGLGGIMKHSGQFPCDYVALEGLPLTLINMGILGLEATALILLTGGDLSGPVCAGIISVSGFGGWGKNYYNVIWLWLGIILLSFVSVWHLNEPGIQLALLFVTCLCGIGGKYGPVYGMITGMVHVMVVRQTGSFFAWINLYNNGFAAGLSCIILVPMIHVVQKMLKKEEES